MSEKPTFTSGDWNPFESIRGAVNKGAQIEGHHAVSGRHLKNALAFQAEHHKNVMEYQERGYTLEKGLMTHGAGLEKARMTTEAGLKEKSESGAMSRNLQLHNAIQKASEGNTAVSINFPTGGGVSYTRKVNKAKAIKPAETYRSVGPVKMAEEPQMEAPAAPAPVAKKQMYAHRDPQTKKISGYKDYPQEPFKPKTVKKKAASKKKLR